MLPRPTGCVIIKVTGIHWCNEVNIPQWPKSTPSTASSSSTIIHPLIFSRDFFPPFVHNKYETNFSIKFIDGYFIRIISESKSCKRPLMNAHELISIKIDVGVFVFFFWQSCWGFLMEDLDSSRREWIIDCGLGRHFWRLTLSKPVPKGKHQHS